jgi:hypothetical protein
MSSWIFWKLKNISRAAKRAVEIAIETDEQAVMAYINNITGDFNARSTVTSRD